MAMLALKGTADPAIVTVGTSNVAANKAKESRRDSDNSKFLIDDPPSWLDEWSGSIRNILS